MVSPWRRVDQWDVQDIVIRIVAELKCRGYVVWLDVEQMAGSTMDAMAAAVEGAAAMLYGVSAKYKESAVSVARLSPGHALAWLMA